MTNTQSHNTNIFSAPEPTLGYIYQIKYSMLLLIQSSDVPNAKISIERLDDIELIRDPNVQLSQLKYHMKSVANLSDRSSDLWKTIRVWSTGIIDRTIDIEVTSCHLITTASVTDNTIAKYLTKPVRERNIDQLVNELNIIAEEGSNQTNKPGYDAYNRLTLDQKKKLIRNIFIFESSMDINQVDNAIKIELRKAIIDVRVPNLVHYLTGWYLEKTISCLSGTTSYITFQDYQKTCFDIIETLKKDNLPADFLNPVSLTEDEIAAFQDRNFVKQLKIIGISGKGVQVAVSDYYRAYEQRSNWLRRQLITPTEEITYEAKLIDDWQRKFDGLMETDVTTTNEKKIEMGKTFYQTHYVANYPRVFIREKFEHTYLITGSCQILSDEKRIGWHPDFKNIV